MSLAQGLALRHTLAIRLAEWAGETVLGCAIGSLIAWIVTLAAAVSLYRTAPSVFSLETIHALTMSGCIVWFQARSLVPRLFRV